MQTLNLLNTIDGQSGYSTDIVLSESDLALLRQMVQMQWLYRLQLLSPENVKHFSQLGIQQYHQASHLIDHASAWPKTARILPREAVSIVRTMDFIKKLEMKLGKFQISDEEHLGWENIYWRLVRPGNSDVGSYHADKWFWEIGGYGKVADFPHRRLKIWMAIHTIAGKNGLMVVPGSHNKKDWQWHSEKRNGLNKPIFDEPIENLNAVLLPLKSGQTVIFHDELIHGGAANSAETTRVSIEFTILIPTYAEQKLDFELSTN